MKMKIFRKFVTVLFLLGALMCTFSPVQAASQEATLSPAVLSASPGQPAQLTLSYNVPEGKQQTTGLGIRIHYNSKAVSNLSIQDVYAEGLVAQDEQAQNDLKDFDNDPETDKYVGIAWIGIQGDWPSMQNVPLKLGQIFVTVRNDGGIGTRVAISCSSKSAGYNFSGHGTSITIK